MLSCLPLLRNIGMADVLLVPGVFKDVVAKSCRLDAGRRTHDKHRPVEEISSGVLVSLDDRNCAGF
jgi:hypothetical protein